jgi:hypothetical protein
MWFTALEAGICSTALLQVLPLMNVGVVILLEECHKAVNSHPVHL